MNIKLTRSSRSDFKDLISWVRSPEELFVWSASTFTFPLDEKQLAKHYRGAGKPGSNRMIFKAVEDKTREHIGHIELTRIDLDRKKASIAFVLINPAKRGMGYGKAMMQNILLQCFQRMEMVKVDLYVFDSNRTAINCYSRLGFEVEKTIEDLVKYNGEFQTLHLMGLNREKWLASFVNLKLKI